MIKLETNSLYGPTTPLTQAANMLHGDSLAAVGESAWTLDADEKFVTIDQSHKGKSHKQDWNR